MTEPIIVLENIRRDYPSGEGTIAVLKDIDLTFQAGEMVAIVGASGSDKSTLMNIIGCLDHPTSGRYRVSSRETASLGAYELAALRRDHFGFIFQRYHLLDELTALGNVEVPAVYAGCARDERTSRAGALLQRLGMADRTHHRPGQLSGGQQQRVSIARALVNDATTILADEPKRRRHDRARRKGRDTIPDTAARLKGLLRAAVQNSTTVADFCSAVDRAPQDVTSYMI